MSDFVQQLSAEEAARRIKKRRRGDSLFRALGFGGLTAATALLLLLLGTIVVRSHGAFSQYEVLLDVTFDEALLDPKGTRDAKKMSQVNFQTLAKRAIREKFPDVKKRKERRALDNLLSIGAGRDLRAMMVNRAPRREGWFARLTGRETAGGWEVVGEDLIGTTQSLWLLLGDDQDSLLKGMIDRDLPERRRRVKDNEIAWLDKLEAEGRLRNVFNKRLFISADSREPELAGVWGAVKGSFFAILICFVASFPIGVAASIYLEEFAPKNRLTDIIEVNINNLAAVPSIVFGLLGLAVFLGTFGWPRSAPWVGGMALALMTLPTIIIASRNAIAAVPYSLREAAYGLGASKLQTVVHHVLPVAFPTIVTGTIIGLAGALGETAPLLMVGMFAFIADIPQTINDPSTALPVQIYIWFDSAERAFVPKTYAAIIVLLGFLIVMNGTAALIRRWAEKKG